MKRALVCGAGGFIASHLVRRLKQEGHWVRGVDLKVPECAPTAAADGGTIEVWGDGKAIRSYTYVEDMVDGIYRLTASSLTEPTNIGSPEYVSVEQLVQTVADVAGKTIRIRYVEGPVGVQSRNFSNERIYSVGWRPRYSLRDGIARTSTCIHAQVGARGSTRRSSPSASQASL